MEEEVYVEEEKDPYEGFGEGFFKEAVEENKDEEWYNKAFLDKEEVEDDKVKKRVLYTLNKKEMSNRELERTLLQ